MLCGTRSEVHIYKKNDRFILSRGIQKIRRMGAEQASGDHSLEEWEQWAGDNLQYLHWFLLNIKIETKK